MLLLEEVEGLLASKSLVVDACRHAVRYAGAIVSLARRPVLFALARALAEAWPGDAARDLLLARAFGARLADESHRGRLRVEVGQVVQPGQPLMALISLDDIWITADIYEDELSRVRIGQPLQAVTTAYPNDVFHGVVQRISPGVDPKTHTLQIRCQVNNPGSKLKPQMLAQVTLDVLQGSTVIVPMAALVFETDRYFAFIDVGGNRYERRAVAIAPWSQDGYARVVTGLVPGDEVVTNGTLQIDQLWHEAHGDNS
jgi:multidrug efflux pump subunit AcrA (membrane-fusion protein)